MLCGETLAKQRGVATNHEPRRRSSHKEWKREDDYQFALHGYLVGTEDFIEADRAFVEKREPRFKGR